MILEDKKLNRTIKLTIVGFLLMIICVLISGGGHGFIEPLYVVFPYSVLLTQFFGDYEWLILLIMFIQFPIYGFIIDKWKTRKTLILILLTHLMAGGYIFFSENKIHYNQHVILDSEEIE